MLLVFFSLNGLIDEAAWAPHPARIRTALRMADISLEKAAVWMGDKGRPMDPSLLRRQLDGEGHLSYRRLSQLPTEFWRWYALLTLDEMGLPLLARQAARFDGVLNKRSQPLYLDSDAQEEKSA